MKKQITITIDEEHLRKLRIRQAKTIKEENKSCSLSAAIYDVLEEIL